MKIRFKQWMHPQMGVVPVDPKTPLVLEAEIEREWVGLTEEEAMQTWDAVVIKYAPSEIRLTQFAKAIEVQLKERNT